jgi:hypothetical protein
MLLHGGVESLWVVQLHIIILLEYEYFCKCHGRVKTYFITGEMRETSLLVAHTQ